MPGSLTTAEVAAGPATYTFVAGETIARFVVDEVLSGNPKTVVGETDAVTGTISLDWGAPTQAALGPIEVDLSGLETDSGFRNRAIREAILQSDKEENRLATFTSTEIGGPGAGAGSALLPRTTSSRTAGTWRRRSTVLGCRPDLVAVAP